MTGTISNSSPDRTLLSSKSWDRGHFGMLEEPLRQSQSEALDAIYQAASEGCKLGHIVLPGGTGKTRIGITLAHSMHQSQQKTLFVLPSQQALEDFAAKAQVLCPEMDVGRVYQGEKRIGNLTFITYASLVRRLLGEEVAQTEVGEQALIDREYSKEHHTPKLAENSLRINPQDYALVIWDEAHNYLTKCAQNALSSFSHALNIGMTATPRYYEGKEVSQSFGPLLYELPYDLAKKRGEVSDYENMLINTDEVTGIKLSSPDREESPAVAKALNTARRNHIVADIYGGMQIDVARKKKTYQLLGEPAVAFAAGIDHVHDIADTINAELMPRLKSDDNLRQILRDKGINPDEVEAIAAPIHSGGTEKHPGMRLRERNALIDKYHERKVLMLTSTSLLQQSFDSPMTSVIIDTVPRQTYVGCGQAGMRALRPGKEMAFVINMEDRDHQSLTLKQCIKERGEEEGVKMVVAPHNGERQYRNVQETDFDNDLISTGCKIIAGGSLTRLINKRIAAKEKNKAEEKNSVEVKEKNNKYIFSKEEHKRGAELLEIIAQGGELGKKAMGEFWELMTPYLMHKKKYYAEKILPFTDEITKRELNDLLIDKFIEIVDRIYTGKTQLPKSDLLGPLTVFSQKYIGNFEETRWSGYIKSLGRWRAHPYTDREENNAAVSDVDMLHAEELRRDIVNLHANGHQHDDCLLTTHLYAGIDERAKISGLPEGTVKSKDSRIRDIIGKIIADNDLQALQEEAVERGDAISEVFLLKNDAATMLASQIKEAETRPCLASQNWRGHNLIQLNRRKEILEIKLKRKIADIMKHLVSPSGHTTPLLGYLYDLEYPEIDRRIILDLASDIVVFNKFGIAHLNNYIRSGLPKLKDEKHLRSGMPDIDAQLSEIRAIISEIEPSVNEYLSVVYKINKYSSATKDMENSSKSR